VKEWKNWLQDNVNVERTEVENAEDTAASMERQQFVAYTTFNIILSPH